MTFAYGFDRPLQEYFFQYMDVNGEIIREGAGSASVLLNEMNELGTKGFPMNHVDDVALDLPIRD